MAVFNSWEADKAVTYRRVEKITDLKGTAVNVVADGLRQQGRQLAAPASASPATPTPARTSSTATT